MVIQVSTRRLTSVEQSLVEHARRGELLDLAADDEGIADAGIDEETMRSWGESRACRASVIRDILLRRLAADIDPHGVRLRGPGSLASLTWKTSPRMSGSSWRIAFWKKASWPAMPGCLASG
jgi:hypothetical protein